MKHKISILGTGSVGSTLGVRLSNLDYQVSFGTRDPQNPKMLQLLERCSQNATVLTIPEAIEQSELILLAVPWEITEELIKSVPDWRGKTIIDCTNPLNSDLTGLVADLSTSAAECIARWAEGAHVIKAFNSVGIAVMLNPQFGSEKATLFICGDKVEAKEQVIKLGEILGFNVVDAEDLISARYLEHMAMFWIHLAIKQGLGSDFALKILKR